MLRFSRPEQRLLEYALLDFSDRELAHHFKLTGDGVKKRWRSIYAKVEAREPALLPTTLRGADRRRVLLQRIRQHLEEIRPYAHVGANPGHEAAPPAPAALATRRGAYGRSS